MTKEELKKEAEKYINNKQKPLTKYDLIAFAEPREKRIADLEQQIEKMKRDVMRNVKWADQNKNEQMYCKLNAMFNQWEGKRG